MAISLARFCQEPRPYQSAAIGAALEVPPAGKLLLASPTGTGKGTIELALLRALIDRGERGVIVTPSLEVLRGYLERCGATADDLNASAERLAKLGEAIHVWTPIRLRNRLKAGKVEPPTVVVVDEAHHAIEENVTGGGLRALTPGAAWIGFTATPYRGNPEETRLLREAWGEPRIILTIPQALERKAWALPRWRIEAILDDDNLDVEAGDLDADEASVETVKPLADLIRTLDLSVPTCVTLPSCEAAEVLRDELRDRETRVVLGETPAVERAEAYERVRRGGALLISVRVLGEGVDFPWLRRWVDASPTLSPVAFLQKLGRITRPNGVAPEYIGTNRNLERHGYLLQGALPRDVVKEAQDAFGGASERGGRAGLIKAVRRLKPITLPLAGGVRGTMWVLWAPPEGTGPARERAILLDPTSDKIVSGFREILPRDQENRFQTWRRADLPEKVTGFKLSKLARPPSEKQLAWWASSALDYGLDPAVVPTREQFSALPVLRDLQETLLPDEERADRLLDAYEALEERRRGRNEADEADRLLALYEGARPSEEPLRTAAARQPPRRGYFTVVRDDGTRRTYRIRTQEEGAAFAAGQTIVDLLTGPENGSDYTGIAFADGARLKVWKRFQARCEEYQRDWAAIVGAAEAAGKRWALSSGNCYVCGRLLTTPESIAAGIGPVCLEGGY